MFGVAQPIFVGDWGSAFGLALHLPSAKLYTGLWFLRCGSELPLGYTGDC